MRRSVPCDSASCPIAQFEKPPRKMHCRFKAAAPVDVMRYAEGERLSASLKLVTDQPDAASLLLSVIADVDARVDGRHAAFHALLGASAPCAESVQALFVLTALCGDKDSHAVNSLGINLYKEARSLHLAALLRHCGCSSGEDALDGLGLHTISDLVHYCSAGDDLGGTEESEASLYVELGGALSGSALRCLIQEARHLCDATASLYGLYSDRLLTCDSDGTDVNAINIETKQDRAGASEDDECEGPLPGTRSVGC